jgi:mono/diheme cytochrome c family protein
VTAARFDHFNFAAKHSAMKRLLRYSMIGLAVPVLLIGGAVSYVSMALPDVGPAPDLRVEITPDRVERGRYLAWHVNQCMDCHSVRDFSLFSAPPTPGTEGAGGDVFDESMGMPGRFVARNITPANLGTWTDGEIYRAITSGVKKNGEPIFPLMPWQNFGKMDDEDVHSVIAYLRTLEPIEASHPDSKADMPFNFILRTLPKKGVAGKRPDPLTDPVAYGGYMLNAAACGDCHTQFEKGEFTGPFLGGGREFQFPDGSILRTPNLTPHPTGLAAWDKETFIARFKQYAQEGHTPHSVAPGEFQTLMPWMMYSGMSEQDLGAIYDYLRTVEPVDNKVVAYTAAR